MRVLITGGTGLLGRALIETAEPACRITATYLGDYKMPPCGRLNYLKLDIRDTIGYKRLFKDFKPEVVIHTAGIGSPDYSEAHQEETWQINVGGTQNIIGNCERMGAKLIYISSNAIYDGCHAPYSETDAAMPINYYGRVKLAGEAAAKKSRAVYAIVRPILLYGWNHIFERPNIAIIALSRLCKGEIVNAYEDVFCNPLFSEECAEAVWRIINAGVYDIFNIAGKDVLSVYDFLKVTAEVFGFDRRLVKPVRQGFFKEYVRRPADTSYSTAKMENVLGLKPLTIREGLEIMKTKKPEEYDCS